MPPPCPHDDGTKLQLAHAPTDGPIEVPDSHLDSVSHHPQPLRAAHVEHVASTAQGSGVPIPSLVHSDAIHDQPAQKPIVGPLLSPA
jgi:hypothetical protein